MTQRAPFERPTTPVALPAPPTWAQALAGVDTALRDVSARIRTARLANRPKTVAFHMALADNLLDLRLRAMKEIP